MDLKGLKRMGSGFVSYYTLREEYLRARRLVNELRKAGQAVVSEADNGKVGKSLVHLRKVLAKTKQGKKQSNH